MDRTEKRLFKLNDELARLRRDEALTLGELEMHGHLHDDDVRDALVSDETQGAIQSPVRVWTSS